MSDVMSVRLRLSGVRVRRVSVDSVDRLEMGVESTRGVVEVPALWVSLRQGVGSVGEAGS